MAFILKQKCTRAFFAATLALLHNSSDGIVAGLSLKVQMKRALAREEPTREPEKPEKPEKPEMKEPAKEPTKGYIGTIASRTKDAQKLRALAMVLEHYDTSNDALTLIVEEGTKKQAEAAIIYDLMTLAEECYDTYVDIQPGNEVLSDLTEPQKAVLRDLLKKIVTLSSLTSSSIGAGRTITEDKILRNGKRAISIAENLMNKLDVVDSSSVGVAEESRLGCFGFLSKKKKAIRVPCFGVLSKKKKAIRVPMYKQKIYDMMSTEDASEAEKAEEVDDFFRNKIPLALLGYAWILLDHGVQRGNKSNWDSILYDITHLLSEERGCREGRRKQVLDNNKDPYTIARRKLRREQCKEMKALL